MEEPTSRRNNPPPPTGKYRYTVEHNNCHTTINKDAQYHVLPNININSREKNEENRKETIF